MRKMSATPLILMLAVVCIPILTSAQASTESSQSKQENTNQDSRKVEPYRLEFSFSELEGGKAINTRHYSLDVTAGSGNELKIGTRVPVSTTAPQSGVNPLVNTQFQYMDVGTKIAAYLRRSGDDLQLEVNSDISNLDIPPEHANSANWRPPVVRQISIRGATLLVTDKPILIGSMDDPNSNRQFQLEVTATKLR